MVIWIRSVELANTLSNFDQIFLNSWKSKNNMSLHRDYLSKTKRWPSEGFVTSAEKVHIFRIVPMVRSRNESPREPLGTNPLWRSRTCMIRKNSRGLYVRFPKRTWLTTKTSKNINKSFGKKVYPWNSLTICLSYPILTTHLDIQCVLFLVKFGHWEMIHWLKKYKSNG